MKDSVSVMIVCNTCYMQKNALKAKKVTFEVFVLVNLQPNLQKKKMTKYFYDIICLQQMLCKYKA